MLHSRSKKINQYSPTVHHVIVLISLDRVSMLLIVSTNPGQDLIANIKDNQNNINKQERCQSY